MGASAECRDLMNHRLHFLAAQALLDEVLHDEISRCLRHAKASQLERFVDLGPKFGAGLGDMCVRTRPIRMKHPSRRRLHWNTAMPSVPWS